MEITREQKIDLLFRANGSDKWQHGYSESYAKHLPEKCYSLLEIGAAKGASAIAWEELYGADLDLHLLDLFIEEAHVSVKWCRRHGFMPHQGDQSDGTVLSRIFEKFSVIVDDGSHRSDHQIISFKHLFFNNLNSGGIYAIEDCHCCVNEFYWGNSGKIESVDDTILGMAKHFIQTRKIVNPFFNEGETPAFENIIEKIEIGADEKIIFIYRK